MVSLHYVERELKHTGGGSVTPADVSLHYVERELKHDTVSDSLKEAAVAPLRGA